MAYDFASTLASEQALTSYLVKTVILSPAQWAGYSNPIQLSWNCVKFDPANADTVPDTTGVYTFVVNPGICQHPATHYLLYLGRARGVTLRRRFKDYLREKTADKGRPPVQLMLNKWPDHLWFYYAPVPNSSVIDALEEDLLAAYLPPVNQSFPATISKILKGVFQ